MTDAAIEARDLTMTYGRRGDARQALDGCSFRLPAGRVCALVGPNGAGKSTLLNLAAGLARPSAGALTVLGSADHSAVRDRIAYVPQDKPLYPQLPARLVAVGSARPPAGR